MERSKYAMLKVAVPFVVFIGVGAYALTLWRKNSKVRPPLFKRSTSLALLHGGDVALQRLIDYHEARADLHKLDPAECELTVLLKDHERPDFRALTRIIAKLEMSGKEDRTIKILEDQIKDAQKKGKMHEAYEFEMLLVEMLIYKGDYEKALSRKCLTDDKISDARRPLFRAIIFLCKEPPKKKEAEPFWEKFCELRTSFGFPPVLKESVEETGIYKVGAKFDEFEKVVNRLKEDVKKAQERKSGK
ncbi:uncharacterized protein LOC21404514 [Morus notabilis]|nr:uncharacterized protein LOC21404514 [Morus notabilis]